MMHIEHYFNMSLADIFWNREKELGAVQARFGRPGFGFVTGRRRIGKTALLRKVCEEAGGLYHQAVEGTPEQQLIHLTEEIKDRLPIFGEIAPRSWSEFFRLLSREKLPKLIVFDEFPYWVHGDPALPSLLQKWIDHSLSKSKTLVIVSGSSQSMFYSQFLKQDAPLYGRASFHLRLPEMSYAWFCRALNFRLDDPASFAKFSLVGGVPHYWKLMPKGPLIRQAEELYFQPSARLAEEPIHWMRDEEVTGNFPKAILDLIGRGTHKPSELASRLGTAQGNLSRPLALLIDLGFIQRELPYGESSRSTKKVLYRVQDAALSFYYGVCLPRRAKWNVLSVSEKTRLIEEHASRQWEYFCRKIYPGSGRYWEKQAEIDLIAPLQGGRFLAAECKWALLGKSAERKQIENLKAKFHGTKLGIKLAKRSKVIFRIFSKKDLARLSR